MKVREFLAQGISAESHLSRRAEGGTNSEHTEAYSKVHTKLGSVFTLTILFWKHFALH